MDQVYESSFKVEFMGKVYGPNLRVFFYRSSLVVEICFKFSIPVYALDLPIVF